MAKTGKGGGAKKVGDWDKLKRMTSGMPQQFKSTINRVLPQVGLKGERIAVMHLRNQDLGWEPLNPEYLAAKLKQGKSEKTLIREAEYIRNITSKVGNMNVFTGVSKKVKTREGEDMADVAKAHEYGVESRGIPARPLWRPTYKELLSWLKKSKIFAVEIAKDLRKR